MKLVSIIIPIYNGEKCMRRAIDSCVTQTYTNLEIILINDGSTDDTKKIATEYAMSDKRVVLCNQSNAGAPKARNYGLKIAKGDYIQFLDCDDTLEHDAIYTSVNELENAPQADFLLFGFNIYLNNKLLRKPNPGDGIYHSGDKYENFKKIQKLMASPCNKLYKKEYITVLFEENRVFAEDTIFNYKNFNEKTTVKTIEKSLYNVQLGTENSVNKRYKKGKIVDLLYSNELEERKMSEIFPFDFNKEDYRIKTLSSLCYIICIMAKNFSIKNIHAELNSVLNLPYYNCLLNYIPQIRLYNKILFWFINKKHYFLLRIYAKLIFIIYSIIN